MPSSTLAELRQHALASGFDLVGAVDAARFDSYQPRDQRLTGLMPECGTAIVVGSGGAMRDPHLARPAIGRLADVIRRQRLRVAIVEPGRGGVSFARLADAAGLGTVSPVTGLLLHPVYGPWVRVHAALLVEGRPFGFVREASMSDQFQPCCKCQQPCLEPVADPAGACPLGAEHRCGGPSPRPLPAPVPISRATRLAISALRFMPKFLRR